MATKDVRSLTSVEVAVIVAGLELKARSEERASRASSNSVIAGEHVREAGIARNLIVHFRNHSLEV